MSIGQFTSTQGRFDVDFDEGCAALEVVITPNIPCPCNIYFDGGSGNPVDDRILVGETVHVVRELPPPNGSGETPYVSAGTYNLIVVHEGLGRDSIQIVVHENIPPEFTASTCSNLEVEVDITDTNYDSYLINYGDGSPATAANRGSNTYAYGGGGTYSVTVEGRFTDANPNCDSNSTSVDILTILPNASISALSLTSSTEATLEFTLFPNVQYFLEIQLNGLNQFQKYLPDPLSGSSLQIDDENLDFEANFYCFRIATFDPCTNTTIDYSNIICSVDLDEISVNHLENVIQSNTSTVESPNQIFTRTNNSTTQIDLIRTFSGATYLDNEITCNVEYCYTITLNYGLSAISTSLPKCAVALSLDTPTAITDISIDATSNPEISWGPPTVFVADTYQISSGFSQLAQTTEPLYTDNTTNPSLASVCYQIGYIDECGNASSSSTTVCSILLSQTTSNDVVNLRWTAFTGWSMGVLEYQLFKVTNGNISELVYSGADLSFEPSNAQDEQITTYQVVAIPNDNLLSDSRSNQLDVTNRSNITFPNAFVANGTNSEFKVVGRYIDTNSFDLKIYTRWGELIAHITDPNVGWDGTRNGRNLPEGNYIYSAEIKDEIGNIHQRSGAVLLIRK